MPAVLQTDWGGEWRKNPKNTGEESVDELDEHT